MARVRHGVFALSCGMLIAMRCVRMVLLGLGLLFVACTPAQPVTPEVPTSGSSAILQPLPPRRYTGPATRIGFEPVTLDGRFQAMTAFQFLPNTNDILALNRSGTVAHYRIDGDRALLLGSFEIPSVFDDGDCGALALTLDPEFSQNKAFYIAYCVDAHFSIIRRYVLSGTAFADTLSTVTTVLAMGVDDAPGAIHPVRGIAFGPDGMLWISAGDWGLPEQSQDLMLERGKILRLQLLSEREGGGYRAAPGNPYANDPARSALVYASGLRNPGPGVFDLSGRFWIPDSSHTFQELNVLTGSGQNFGWPLSDGFDCNGACVEQSKPLVTYDASSFHPFIFDDPLISSPSLFRSIWVAPPYRASGTDPYSGLLTNKIMYGDMYLGWIRAREVDAALHTVSDAPIGHLPLAVAWGQGRDGYLYAGTLYSSYDPMKEDIVDSAARTQTSQAGLWRAVPLP